MKCCETCSNVMEEKIGNAFEKYGKFVARHPWKVILLVVILNGCLAVGMIKLNVVIDVERIYTPIGSQASKDAEKVRNIFPDFSGSNYIGYQMPDLGRYGEVIVIPNNGNILNRTFLTKLREFYTFLLSINATDSNGKTVTLNDICAKTFGKCAVDGDLFVDNSFTSDVNASKPVPFPYYLHPSRGPIYYEQLVGSASSFNSTLISATMLLLRVNLRTDSEYFIHTAKNWQSTFLDEMKKYKSPDFEVAFSHSDSLSEELNENVNGDITLFAVTFTIIITYACVATMTARCDVVGQKSNLGYAGVIAAGLSIVSAFGLGSMCGLEFVSIVGVVPFLIIGIGVDDMFVLMSGIMNADYKNDVETRVGQMMRTAGVSITITSLTDLLAFAAGASSVFLSVRNFCIYAGIAVLFCYVNQATLFVASIAINEQRTAHYRHFFACCIVLNKPSSQNLCCTGRKPNNINESESYLDRFPKWLIPKLISSVPCKIVILCLFVGYLAVSIWGVTGLKEGLVLQNLVSDKSYYYKYRDYLDKDFSQNTLVSFVFEDNTFYSNDATQQKINGFLSEIKVESTIQDNIEINWLSEYRKDTVNYNNASEQAFINGLFIFLSINSNARFRNDILFSASNNSIIASRIYIMSKSIKQSQEQGKFMLRMRELAKKSSLQVFAFSPAFLFYEQYVVILSQTLQTLGIGVGMVFLVTCIFMPHPLMLLYITVTVSMITTGVIGFLYFLGLTLSSITMIHIIMSIGFSVDFAAHICHGFMISTGGDIRERIDNGIKATGAPIFHGAMSSILGVIMLAFAKSYVFNSFFKVMSLVIVFGITHALFFLPVVLSLTYPAGKPKVSTSNRNQENTNTSDTKQFGGQDARDRNNSLNEIKNNNSNASALDLQTINPQ